MQIETYLWERRASLYRVAYTYVRNEQDALDVVSQSIVKVLQSQSTLPDEQAATAWVYRVVINTAKDHLRKFKRVTVGLSTEESACDQDPSERLDLFAAIDRLPEKYRTVIVLHYFEDMKLSDIAAIRGEKLSTVKSRLHRALDLIRADAALKNYSQR